MSAQHKKDRKQQKRRRRKQRESAHREKRELAHEENIRVREAASTTVEELRFDGPETLESENSRAQPLFPKQRRGVEELLGLLQESASGPAPLPDREETEADIWWGTYSNADGVARLQMTREKLETVSTHDEEYEQFFPEAIYDLESKLAREDYVVFLEELREAHPEVFSLSGDWHVRTMVFEYLAQERVEDADCAVMRLADELQELGEPFFSLTSTIRLAGRTEAAQALVDSAVTQFEGSSLMHWAVDEILDWAMFEYYQRCVAAGVTDEAIGELHAAAHEIGIEDAEESQANRRDYVLHLAGKSGKQWNKDELISGKKKAFRNIYLLGADYQRWLCQERAFAPIVADELRRLVIGAIDRLDCPFNGLLTGLPRQHFDRYLAGKLGFMSLDRIHAPASIIAMKQYYDFLKELELVKPGAWQKSQAVCDGLWKQLHGAIGDDEWKPYVFLEQYSPS